MARPLAAGRFLFTVGWRIAAFVAVSFAFPWIVAAIQQATACTGTEGYCWAVAALSGTVLRLAILGLLALFLIRPVWRRARTVGAPRIAGLIVAALVFLDWRFLTAVGGYLPVSFARSLLDSGLPFFTALALAIILLLAVAPMPVGPGDTLWRRRGLVGWVAWPASGAVAILAALSGGLFLAWMAHMASGGGLSPLAADAIRAGRVANGVALATLAAFVWMILAEALRRQRAAGAEEDR